MRTGALINLAIQPKQTFSSYSNLYIIGGRLWGSMLESIGWVTGEYRMDYGNGLTGFRVINMVINI